MTPEPIEDIVTEPIIVMLNYSRSGGTLLTRMLGMLPDVVMVSEVNPARGVLPDNSDAESASALRAQMQEWHDLALSGQGFDGCIAEIVEWCQTQKRRFILRDWTQLEFRKSQLNGFAPTQSFSVLDRLGAKYQILPFALVRDGIDVFLSSNVPLDDFAAEYLAYVEALKKAGVVLFRYEDLVSDPEAFVKALCVHAGLAYGDGWRRYEENPRCTGDVQLGKRSRGIRQAAIRRLPRKWSDAQTRSRIDACQPLAQANRLLGYPETYDGAEVESMSSMLARKARNKVTSLV
jgi:hypothetical protein